MFEYCAKRVAALVCFASMTVLTAACTVSGDPKPEEDDVQSTVSTSELTPQMEAPVVGIPGEPTLDCRVLNYQTVTKTAAGCTVTWRLSNCHASTTGTAPCTCTHTIIDMYGSGCP